MQAKIFNKRVKDILKNYNLIPSNNHYQYSINTPFGKLDISPNATPRIKVYTLFMRFETWDESKLKQFQELYSRVDTPSNNGKWNHHVQDPKWLLDKLEEVCSSMEYLGGKK